MNNYCAQVERSGQFLRTTGLAVVCLMFFFSKSRNSLHGMLSAILFINNLNISDNGINCKLIEYGEYISVMARFSLSHAQAAFFLL